MPRKNHPTSAATPPNPPPAHGLGRALAAVTALSGPSFAQPVFSADPTQFTVPHGSDAEAYQQIDTLNREHKIFPLSFPNPRGMPEPVLRFDQVMGDNGAASKAIAAAGRMVFHALGDSGAVGGPATQNAVADKLVADFDEQNAADAPRFLFHLGDVVYSFGEAKYYYDQFYDAYRDYPAPILSLAGNHDGMVAPGVSTPTLDAFLRNFCQTDFAQTPEAGGLSRTAQIQPGVFFTYEAPFVRILALYSGTLEDPGVIANDALGDGQLTYLAAALARAKREAWAGALIIAHHHPAYTAGSLHGWSTAMLAQIDAACAQAGLWPHAVLSGHAHNYQRFTRSRAAMRIPYLVAGNGGHGLARLSRKGGTALRVPMVIQPAGAGVDQVVLECYDDQDYGYLRIIADAARLRIEYHPASDGAAAKTPDDVVTVDLATRTLI